MEGIKIESGMSREVDEIKSRIDIVDLVGEYVKLNPAGANHKGLCPFHNEKTSSFMVNQSKQIWRCFGCGEGGDLFSFFMKVEGIEFGEALKLLAKRTGVVLPDYQPSDIKKDSQNDIMLKILDLTARYWHKILLDSTQAKAAKDYLIDRKITEESIIDFKIGYSIDQWDNLINFLKKKNFSDRELFSAGLTVKRNGASGFYDRFRGRIMFPISDIHGRIVGFGGRTLNKEEQAKYINSPQSETYNKSAVLFGLNLAKNYIKKNNLCILVEGYMDVIPSHQAGIKNVASISGTALTQEQIVLIKRFTTNLALALDMDLAGQNAAERSADLALQNEMNVSVITLPYGKDPGECATNNPQDWKRAIEEAKPIMQYFLDRAISDNDLSLPENKKNVAKYYLAKIIGLPNKIDQEFWLKKLSDKISVSEKVLWESFPKGKIKQNNRVINTVNSNLIVKRENKKEKNYLILQRIFSILFIFPNFAQKLIDELPTDMFQGELDILYKKFIMYYTKNIDSFNSASDQGTTFDLFDSLNGLLDDQGPDYEFKVFLEESFLLSQNESSRLSDKEIREELANFINILKADYINSKITALKAQLEEAEQKSDRQKLESIYSELNEYIRRRALLN
ncbi:MAG: DNA primase [Candidatus Buchananbacteria bacterium]